MSNNKPRVIIVCARREELYNAAVDIQLDIMRGK
jgi:hypothetical protein